MINTSNLQALNSTFNNVTGTQFNFGNNATVTVNNPEFVPPRRVNDAPIDLLAANFMGRLRDLDFLSRRFGARNVATEEDVPTRCAVYGMPGVGKTKLVLRFAQVVFVELLFSHIFWMSAATPDRLIEGMAKILDLVGHPDRTRSEQNAKLTAARLWLEDSQRVDGIRWLLILDNVDKSALAFLREHLPRWNVKGNILFTTRSADIAEALVHVSGQRHSKLELRVPDLVETTHLLFSSAGIDASAVTLIQRNQAEQLVRNLGSLPLAVVQAASYMRQTDIKLNDMLQISKGERKIEMIEWESDLASDQQRSVVATFNTLFDQLERDFPDTYDVLRILSFLDPEDVPLGMLTDGARMLSPLLDKPPPGNSQPESSIVTRIAKWTHIRTLSRHRSRSNSSDTANPTRPLPELLTLLTLLLSPTAFPKALRKLQSLSLVESLSRDGEPSLHMHDVVHFMTREHVKKHTAYQAWLESAVSLVCSVFRRLEDPESPRWWSECEKLMPHVRSLSKVWTDGQGVSLKLVNAEVRLARYLNSRGRYNDAERLCEHNVGRLRAVLGDKHDDTLWASHYLAHVYYNQRRFANAEKALAHILELRKKELGADDEDTLTTMNDLALVHDKQGRHREAEQLYQRVLAVREKKLGHDHSDTLTTMHNLALVYRSQERYDEAEELFKHVLAREEKYLGPDHVETLTTANHLAIVYRSQAKHDNAEELFTRALVGWEKQLGPSHPLTLTAAAHLALLYQSQARNDEAERHYLRALTGMKPQLGANHPDTLWCAKAFAAFYRSQGRNSEADALFDSRQG